MDGLDGAFWRTLREHVPWQELYAHETSRIKGKEKQLACMMGKIKTCEMWKGVLHFLGVAWDAWNEVCEMREGYHAFWGYFNMHKMRCVKWRKGYCAFQGCFWMCKTECVNYVWMGLTNRWGACRQLIEWRGIWRGKLPVTISYLSVCTFLICVLRCMFFPLGLASYMEDQYTFTLGPRSFSLAPIPEGEPTPVPVLLFASWVGRYLFCLYLLDLDRQPHSSR